MLEDLFSDNLVDTPDDIERVIEGGEGENQIESGKESENEEKKAENETDKDKDKTKVKRKLGPRPVINSERLKGPRGIGIMEQFFSDIKLYGKGREREDLDIVMKRLEHWTHRLCPRMQFDDSLKKIEKLGSKKDVANYVKRIRLGMEDDVSEERPINDDPDSPPPPEVDPFDQLLSSVPARPDNTDITSEQRDQMLRNRLIAEERRAARIKRAQEMQEKFLTNQRQNVVESVGENDYVESVGENDHVESVGENDHVYEHPQETDDTEVLMDIDDINAAFELGVKENSQTEIGKGHTDTLIENDKHEFAVGMKDNARDTTSRKENERNVTQITENQFNSLESNHNPSDEAERVHLGVKESVEKNKDIQIELSQESSDTEAEVLMDIDEINAAIELGATENYQFELGKGQVENTKDQVPLGMQNNESDTTAGSKNEPDIKQITEHQFDTVERDESQSHVAEESETQPQMIEAFEIQQGNTEKSEDQ